MIGFIKFYVLKKFNGTPINFNKSLIILFLLIFQFNDINSSGKIFELLAAHQIKV